MWKSELEFADKFEDYLYSKCQNQHTHGKDTIVLREYRPGYGCVDMVTVQFDIGRLKKRQQRLAGFSNSITFDKLEAYGMAYLSATRWVSVSKFRNMLNVGNSQANHIITNLKSRGLIETRDNCVKAHSKEKNWVIDYIETFELKLKNWKRAIEQATRHLWFASSSFVVMPDFSKKISQQLSKNCYDLEVGAILHKSNDNWKTVIKPPLMQVPLSQIGWFLNESIFSQHAYA